METMTVINLNLCASISIYKTKTKKVHFSQPGLLQAHPNEREGTIFLAWREVCPNIIYMCRQNIVHYDL